MIDVYFPWGPLTPGALAQEGRSWTWLAGRKPACNRAIAERTSLEVKAPLTRRSRPAALRAAPGRRPRAHRAARP